MPCLPYFWIFTLYAQQLAAPAKATITLAELVVLMVICSTPAFCTAPD